MLTRVKRVVGAGLVALVVLATGACGGGGDAGVASSGNGTATSQNPSTATEPGSGTPAGGDGTTTEPNLECLPPSTELITELNTFVAQPEVGTLTASQVATVRVYQVTHDNQQWYVVAAPNLAYLTNAPGTDIPSALWVRVDSDDGWNNVDWSAEEVARGQEAKTFAVGCLH